MRSLLPLMVMHICSCLSITSSTDVDIALLALICFHPHAVMHDFLIRIYTGSYETVIFNLIFLMFFYLAFIFLPAYELLLLYIRCYVAHNVEHLLELLPIEQLTFCDG